MQISKERLEELRQIYKKDFNTDLTDQELHDAAFNLVGYYDTLSKMAFQDIQDHLRLEKEPNGWPFAGRSGTCKFCGYYFETNDFWFDMFGFKCKSCQRAVNEGVIPGSICRNKEEWFSFETLKEKFGIHSATARSLIRKGELKVRVILNDAGKPHFTVFTREDNYKFLKIDKDAPMSELEDYDLQVAKWAEDYKKKMVEGQKSGK